MTTITLKAPWLAAFVFLACLSAAAPPAWADPSLWYSTYLGGNHWEEGLAVATDAAGNTYVAGLTFSADFPTRGPSPPLLGISDAFVAKLDPAGTLLFSRRLGGSGNEEAAGIAVDAAGNIWVTGFTESADFPRVSPIGQPMQAGDVDAFVVKLSPDGSTLLQAATLGGTGFDRGNAIAVDELGSVSIVGSTRSTDFPIRGIAIQPTALGGLDGFLARLAPDGTLSCVTYLGGSADDETHGIANWWSVGVRVVGTTNSPDLRLGYNSSQPFRGGKDAFYYSLVDCGVAFSGTYLGGSGDEEGLAIASDPEGGVSIAGSTTSPDFPVEFPLQRELRGAADAFVVRFRSDGFKQWATYLGGSGRDGAEGVAVSPMGETTVTGLTYSLDFPVAGAIQDRCAPEGAPGSCLADAFVTRLDHQAGIVWSTYLGGTRSAPAYDAAEEGARDVAIDPAGNAYVTGWTYSLDFPTVNAFQPELSPAGEGENDAFITKIVLTRNRAPDCFAATADPAVLWPPNGRMVPVSVTGLTDPDGDPVTVRITAIHQDEPLAGNDPDAGGLGTSIATLRAARSGQGDGRVYRLGFQATDPEGFTCAGQVTVCVPHGNPSAACGDGGETVESTSPLPRGSALAWSTYLGGSGDEVKLADVEVDASGHAWIAGTTASDDYTGVMDEYPEEDEHFVLDAFATRLDPTGGLVRSMVWGRSDLDEHVEGLAIGPSGAVSLAGWYDSYEDYEVIATQIRPDGPVESFDYYNGEEGDFSYAVTTDRVGNVYIAGSSGSHYFPGFGEYLEDRAGNYVLKLSPDHDYFPLGLFFLKNEVRGPSAIAVDHAGNIYVTGIAPGGGPFIAADVRVVKLDPSGNLLWKTTLGGSKAEGSTSLKVDSAGRAWVAGWTESPDFPVRGGRLYAGGRDAFLVRLTPGGVIDLSTLLGGTGTDEAHDLALDAGERPYLAGLTASADFPRAGALPGSCGATAGCGTGSDAFAASFDFFAVSNLVLTFSTYLGGGSSDQAYGVAVDPGGSFLWVSGLTRSVDFPTLKPWQPVLAGEGDVFVTKIVLGAPGKTSPK